MTSADTVVSVITDTTIPDPPAPDAAFAIPATAEQLARAAEALAVHGFSVEILDDAGAARARLRALLPEGGAILTAASETTRLSGIQEDINASGRYQAIGPRIMALDRATQLHDIRVLTATPEVVGSVAAVTETGSLLAVSASGSQIPAYGGGAARPIWVVGAQKVVPDLATAMRRIETYAYPLEDARARAAYGRATAANQILIINGEPYPGRSTVLLVRQVIGY
jgi:hypothetical protein